MSTTEARLVALETQVAELMRDKVLRDKVALTKFLESNATEPAGDAFVILRENPFAAKGAYCVTCWSEKSELSFLDLSLDEIPSALSAGASRSIQCPGCQRILNIQWENR